MHTISSYSTVQKYIMYTCACVQCHTFNYHSLNTLIHKHIHTHTCMYNSQKKFFMTQSMPSDIFFTDIYTTRIIQIFHTITSKRYDHEDNNISWMCNKKISLNDFSTDGYEWYTDKIGFKLLYTDPCNKNRFLHIFQLHKLP